MRAVSFREGNPNDSNCKFHDMERWVKIDAGGQHRHIDISRMFESAIWTGVETRRNISKRTCTKQSQKKSSSTLQIQERKCFCDFPTKPTWADCHLALVVVARAVGQRASREPCQMDGSPMLILQGVIFLYIIFPILEAFLWNTHDLNQPNSQTVCCSSTSVETK